jgi:hypothetical protein
MLVVGFDDPISDPVAEVTLFVQSAVVKSFRKIGLIFVGDEGSLDFFFMPLRSRSQLGTRDTAGNQFGRESRFAIPTCVAYGVETCSVH